MQLPIVTILVSVGISGLCGIFVTFDFRGIVTFGEQKKVYKVRRTELFFDIKDENLENNSFRTV